MQLKLYLMNRNLHHQLISFYQVNCRFVYLTIRMCLGHTHAGQLYTLVPLAYWGNAYYYGLYTHDRSGAQIYVSSGVNYWGPPVKMAGRCEIVLIELLSS
jgi:hypothetical protein